MPWMNVISFENWNDKLPLYYQYLPPKPSSFMTILGCKIVTVNVYAVLTQLFQAQLFNIKPGSALTAIKKKRKKIPNRHSQTWLAPVLKPSDRNRSHTWSSVVIGLSHFCGLTGSLELVHQDDTCLSQHIHHITSAKLRRRRWMTAFESHRAYSEWSSRSRPPLCAFLVFSPPQVWIQLQSSSTAVAPTSPGAVDSKTAAPCIFTSSPLSLLCSSQSRGQKNRWPFLFYSNILQQV